MGRGRAVGVKWTQKSSGVGNIRMLKHEHHAGDQRWIDDMTQYPASSSMN